VAGLQYVLAHLLGPVRDGNRQHVNTFILAQCPALMRVTGDLVEQLILIAAANKRTVMLPDTSI
jgi:hypothetical protein